MPRNTMAFSSSGMAVFAVLVIGACEEESATSEIVAHDPAERDVQQLMQGFAAGRFKPFPPGGRIVSGWKMTDRRGMKHSRSDLQYQAEEIIALGKDTVPELIRWLRHDEPYVLFIAAYSLKRITGEDPTFYYFGTPGEPFNGEDKWFERCVETWRKWHEDRVHGKDQGN